MVPDLVVFLVGEGGFVEPGQFGAEVCVEGFEDFGAVEPLAQ
jgi:hypothetical protein